MSGEAATPPRRAHETTDEGAREARDAGALTDREVLEEVLAFARSGWRKDGAPYYCLVCDESLSLRPGQIKGQRAATFEEIAHDPECPIPFVAEHLSRASVSPGSAGAITTEELLQYEGTRAFGNVDAAGPPDGEAPRGDEGAASNADAGA